MRERLRMNYDWTPRQREVLDLMARGRTNTQIGEELGISLDGAKWHVSEILSKLQAESREEAAEYWRRYNGFAPRFERIFRGITGGIALKWVAGTAAIAVAGAAAAAIIAIAINQSSSEPSVGDPDVPGAVTPDTGTGNPGGAPGNPGGNDLPSGNIKLSFAAPVTSLQNATMYVVTGCTQCDGPDATLQKHVFDGSGKLTTTTVLESGKGSLSGWTIGLISAAPNASRLVAVTCDSDSCSGLGPGDPSTTWTVFVSTDGGTTWRAAYDVTANFVSVSNVTDDAFIANITAEGDGPAYRLVSDSGVRAISAPGPAGQFARPFIGGDGKILWVKGDRSGIVRDDGTVFPLTPPSGSDGLAYDAVRALPDGLTAVSWAKQVAGTYSEIIQFLKADGTVASEVEGNGSAQLRPVGGSVLIGNVYSTSIGLPDNATSYPVLIDAARGTSTPITADVFTQQRGRNRFIAFQAQ
jgi:DNA-binding CsgD family transcriptional regulator